MRLRNILSRIKRKWCDLDDVDGTTDVERERDWTTKKKIVKGKSLDNGRERGRERESHWTIAGRWRESGGQPSRVWNHNFNIRSLGIPWGEQRKEKKNPSMFSLEDVPPCSINFLPSPFLLVYFSLFSFHTLKLSSLTSECHFSRFLFLPRRSIYPTLVDCFQNWEILWLGRRIFQLKREALWYFVSVNLLMANENVPDETRVLSMQMSFRHPPLDLLST